MNSRPFFAKVSIAVCVCAFLTIGASSVRALTSDGFSCSGIAPVNKLVSLAGANISTAVISPHGSLGGVVGIASSPKGCFNSSIQVTESGLQTCVFDSATTAGDYVNLSFSVDGDCHDAGTAYPTTGQVIGRVLSTNAVAGTYTIDLVPTEINL